MKKTILTILLAALTTPALHAQVFTLGDGGEALPNNAEITADEVEEDPFEDKMIVNSGLFIKNTMKTNVRVKIEYTIESISNGNMQICYPGSCVFQEQPGTYVTGGPDVIEPGGSRNIQTEWFPTEEGYCRIKYTIKRFTASGTPQGSGNTVTVNYLYGVSADAIASLKADEVVSVKYFDILGREIPAPTQGIYLKQTITRSGKVVTGKVMR